MRESKETKWMHITDLSIFTGPLIPQGAIRVKWECEKGWGVMDFVLGEDGMLHADTECMASNENKEFINRVLAAVVEERVLVEV